MNPPEEQFTYHCAICQHSVTVPKRRGKLPKYCTTCREHRQLTSGKEYHERALLSINKKLEQKNPGYR